MSKFRLKKYYSGIVFFIILIYLEFVFRIFCGINIFNISMLYVILYSLLLSFVFNVIVKLFNSKCNKVLYYVLLCIISLIYLVQVCVYKMFGFFFDWSLLDATGQVASFAGDGVRLVMENILGVILILVPLIALIIFRKSIVLNRDKMPKSLIKLGSAIVIYIIFILTLNINKNDINSSYELYNNVNNIELNVKRFGVLNSFWINTKRTVFGFEEVIDIVDNKFEEGNNDNPEIKYGYNNLEIDFDKLISEEKSNSIKQMHEYFKHESGTLQNEYTEYFKGKNLILFMAESFNEVAVREDITPTLYKLVNSGFTFNNFYTPTISSTIGGEFQEVTGLVAASGFLSPWKKGANAYPMGLANSFKDLGYSTFAYHNNSYTFQSRNKYLKAIGFDNFLGCKNGLEKRINCKQWPESDVEMIETTFDDYINSEKPFFTYYVTVSGHGDYSFSYSATSRKHKDDVKHLNYSEKPLAYLAAQVELNDALELLIDKLEASGKLDDTVIALVGDHYPYYLSTNEVNEIASYKKDSVVEINRSNFILWNSKMEKIPVDKVGSQIDVLPTLYNLFGVKYDSRLIIGKDILSTEPGLAIFGNQSWVSDKGTYFASSNKFVAKEKMENESEYVKIMNKIVSNKVIMSKNIMTNDYYRKVLGES